MKNSLKEFKNIAKHTRLSPEEKSTMRGALLRYMEANPATGVAPIRSPFFSIRSLRSKKVLPLFIACGLVVGGTLSFAAENTLPGNVLYPVKIHLNEAIRGAFALTPKQKAAWEVLQVERRLEETEKLATDPGVSLETEQRAQKNLLVYTDHVKERIVKFEEQDDSEDALLTAKNLSDIFRQHEDTLHVDALQKSETQASTTIAVPRVTPSESRQDRDPGILLEVVGTLRSNAEGKQKELEQKYHASQEFEKDKNLEKSQMQTDDKKNKKGKDARQSNGAFMNVTPDTVTTTTAPQQEEDMEVKPSRTGINNKYRRLPDMHEEIRSTPGDVSASSTIEYTGKNESVKNIEM